MKIGGRASGSAFPGRAWERVNKIGEVNSDILVQLENNVLFTWGYLP
jgi:hypothetical protein